MPARETLRQIAVLRRLAGQTRGRQTAEKAAATDDRGADTD
jgi:hypothetical protein